MSTSEDDSAFEDVFKSRAVVSLDGRVLTGQERIEVLLATSKAWRRNNLRGLRNEHLNVLEKLDAVCRTQEAITAQVAALTQTVEAVKQLGDDLQKAVEEVTNHQDNIQSYLDCFDNLTELEGRHNIS